MWYTKTSKDIKQTACVASWMTEQTAGRAKRLVWKLVRNFYANKKKKKSHQISEATSPSLIKCQKHQQPPLPFLRKWFNICKWRWLSRALSSRKKKKKHSLLYSFKECFFFFPSIPVSHYERLGGRASRDLCRCPASSSEIRGGGIRVARGEEGALRSFH